MCVCFDKVMDRVNKFVHFNKATERTSACACFVQASHTVGTFVCVHKATEKVSAFVFTHGYRQDE